MHTAMDQTFEKAMCDHWWVQDNAQVVKNSQYEYLKSAKDHRLYNAVIRVSPQLDHYQKLVNEVMKAHQGKGSEWRIGAPSYTKQLENTVLEAGYTVDGVADAWSIDVNAKRPPCPDDIIVCRVESLQDLRDMDTVACQAFSKIKPKSDKELTKELSMCTRTPPRCLRFVAYDKQTRVPLASGGLNIYPTLSLGFMWAGCTVAHARGRGIYSAVVTERMKYAKAQGIDRIGLYAMRDTSGPIVEAQGFDKHGPIFFWGSEHIADA